MRLLPATLAHALPATRWIAGYRRRDLSPDLIAGATTAVMLIPQAMAYAMLAGLPPIVGLYASLLPLLAYALLGTSRQLAVGPVAMDSLLVAQGLAPFAALGGETYVAYAAALALLVGVLHGLMGVFRLGFLVNFLSRPVMAGFTSAAALIIASSQLAHVLGVSLPRGAVWSVLGDAAAQLASWHGPTLIVALLAIAGLVLLKRYAPRVPRALVVVVAATLGVRLLGLEAQGVAVVGTVPEGLPRLRLPDVAPERFFDLLPVAGPIALVALMEAMSVGKAVAQKLRYEITPNQELFALGAANLAAGLSQGYPITGGFSRTAVNAAAGARTPLAGVVTAALVALTLLFLTPLFHDLPKAVLAAIIMTAVIGLVDVAQARHLWRVARPELGLMALTFAATLGLGIGEGILVGVGASLATFVMGTTRPHVAVLGRLPGTETYRNVLRYPEAEPTRGVLAVRIDAQLYFGNVSFWKQLLADLEETVVRRSGTPLRAVVLDMSAVTRLDSSAEAALAELHAGYRARELRLVLAAARGPVRDVMDRSGLLHALGPEGRAISVHQAMRALDGREARPDTAIVPRSRGPAAEALLGG